MSSLGIWVFALPSIRQTWQILHFQWRLSWPNYDMENILMIRYRPLSFHLLQAKAGLLHRQKYFCKHLWQQHLVASPTLKGLNMDKVKTNSNQKHTKCCKRGHNSPLAPTNNNKRLIYKIQLQVTTPKTIHWKTLRPAIHGLSRISRKLWYRVS